MVSRMALRATALVLLASIANGEIFSCNLELSGKAYDLSSLGGNHEITVERSTPPTRTTLSWYFNPCGELTSGYSEHSCDSGTQICGVETVTLPNADKVVTQIIPLVSKSASGGSPAQISALADGLSVVTIGSRWGDDTNLTSRVDYICQSDSSDLFNVISWDGQELHLEIKSSKACVQGTKPKKPDNDNKDKNKDGSKEPEKKPDEDNDESSSWGIFTWIFILFVLGFAGYVIGGAWINYNEHGLTGVELLPHSDTLRDLPYLIRDFANKVVNTFAGSGAREGYSAV